MSEPNAHGRFTGTSDSGDFGEALHNAITEAKGKLRAERVSWNLADVKGVNGGIIPEDKLSVTVQARVARDED